MRCVRDRAWEPYLISLPLALAPLVIAVWNGAPLVFLGDTNAYFAVGISIFKMIAALVASDDAATVASGQLTLGRSVAYGIVAAALTYIASPWVLIYAQSWLSCAVMALLFRRLAPDLDVAWLALSVVALSATTSFGLFSVTLLPDFLTPLLIVALALLSFGRAALNRFDRFFLTGVAVMAGLGHDTNLLIGLALCVIWTVWSATPALRTLLPCARGSGVALTAWVALIVGWNAASQATLHGVTGQPSPRMPFLTSHLIDMGPGQRFIDEGCGERVFVVCETRHDPDLNWSDLIFDADAGLFVAQSEATRMRISDEQIAFALAVMTRYPVETMTGLLADALKQLTRFGVGDLQPRPNWATFAERLPAPLKPLYHDSRIADPATASAFFLGANVLVHATTLLAAAALAVAAARAVEGARMHTPTNHPVVGVVIMIVAGVVLNGLICGALASPYSRFGARVIFLLPAIALILWLTAQRATRDQAERLIPDNREVQS